MRGSSRLWTVLVLMSAMFACLWLAKNLNRSNLGAKQAGTLPLTEPVAAVRPSSGRAQPRAARLFWLEARDAHVQRGSVVPIRVMANLGEDRLSACRLRLEVLGGKIVKFQPWCTGDLPEVSRLEQFASQLTPASDGSEKIATGISWADSACEWFVDAESDVGTERGRHVVVPTAECCLALLFVRVSNSDFSPQVTVLATPTSSTEATLGSARSVLPHSRVQLVLRVLD